MSRYVMSIHATSVGKNLSWNGIWRSSYVQFAYLSHKKMGRAGKAAKGATSTSATKTTNEKEESAIEADKNGQILLRVHAKPNAKRSRITEIGSDSIEVALAAPPRDGQANEALIDAMAEILGLRKGDIALETGSRSRSKLITVNSQRITLDEVRAKLQKSVDEQ
ncbi:unnamed protein product [Anisakis simplex]|uniref:UPF0235 protein C15orf40 homolog n=1 Tax=Anisakis simplex TaxID=6269 RepID=A0A0M3JZT2_ANISI|nr:unnamed protein product [Anisakis simplex]